jgi:tRNA(fMet)-specific endonuclease VapC
MRYLLDTNMVSDLVRNPQGKVPARIARVGEESVCTSITVAAELRYGAARKGSTRLLAQLLTVLDAFEILPSRRQRKLPMANCAPAWKLPVSRSAGTIC